MSILERVGFGPLEGLPTLFNKTDLSTTAVKVTLPTLPAGGNDPLPTTNVKVKITNPSAAATIAWTLVKRGGGAPTITADYNATTGGSPIVPGGVEIFSIPADKDLYVVASAAATSINVTSFLFL